MSPKWGSQEPGRSSPCPTACLPQSLVPKTPPPDQRSHIPPPSCPGAAEGLGSPGHPQTPRAEGTERGCDQQSHPSEPWGVPCVPPTPERGFPRPFGGARAGGTWKWGNGHLPAGCPLPGVRAVASTLPKDTNNSKVSGSSAQALLTRWHRRALRIYQRIHVESDPRGAEGPLRDPSRSAGGAARIPVTITLFILITSFWFYRNI